MPLPDWRHHVYVIGKTGSGKTTLLRNLILQHIALGHGVGLIDHLWHKAIFETFLSHEEAEAWRALSRFAKPAERYREEFRAAGWEFGAGVINGVRCPGCPKDAKPNPSRVATNAALEELLGDDEDGLAATFEDSGDYIMAEARDLHSRWPKMTQEEKRKIAETLVKCVVIGKGEVTLNLCYLASFKEMTTGQRIL